jgi:integrase
MVLYGTGMRRTEVSLLKVSDLDSQRMIIRVERGKGGAGRDLPLSPALLETLREYWHWKKPRKYLFPSSERKRGQDKPISDKTVWYACRQAAQRAGIAERVTPRTCCGTLRHTTPPFRVCSYLKTIGPDHAHSAAVYGRSERLGPVPARLVEPGFFGESPTEHSLQLG